MKQLTSCRLQWVWSCLRWNPLKQGWALAMRLSYYPICCEVCGTHNAARSRGSLLSLICVVQEATWTSPGEVRKHKIISERFQDLHNLKIWHFACFMCSPSSSCDFRSSCGWWKSIHLPQPLTKTGSPTGESCGGIWMSETSQVCEASSNGRGNPGKFYGANDVEPANVEVFPKNWGFHTCHSEESPG